jgi:hypothetical protein
LFPLPHLSDNFITVLADLFNDYATASSREDFTLTAAMLLPSLVLQRPNRRSKPRDHIACMERRLPLFKTPRVLNCSSRKGCAYNVISLFVLVPLQLMIRTMPSGSSLYS